MTEKIELRKCKNRKCRDVFMPLREWQRYCSIRCRSAVANRRRSALIRKAQKLMETQQGAA